MLAKILDFFTSLKLTVWCLALALVLVFIGTIAQVKMGLWIAQENYFQSLFVYWSPAGSSLKIPVWPGGYLLGGILLVNLVASHIRRFKYTRKKAGIILVHFGLILLFLGQFFTELFQIESYMTISEGATRNYSESHRSSELAIIETSNPQWDQVVAIPEDNLKDGAEIQHPDLPFPIRVKKYWLNSAPKLNDAGVIEFVPQPRATKMNDRDIPVVTVEIPGEGGGEFTLSNWRTESRLLGFLRREMGPMQVEPLARPERITYKGKTYELAMRPERYYKPFSLHLLDFAHDRYSGTEIPKNYSSRVRLQRKETGEDREILIYMNNPLRYNGETYYQASFEPGDTGTVLQVVRNPTWLTPYISCVLVCVGLLVQFLSHLVAFTKKRRTA